MEVRAPSVQGEIGRMMITIKKILFPTDFSTCAEQALEHCLGLARACEASVTLLHVQIMLDNTPVETDRQELEALLDRFQGQGAENLKLAAAAIPPPRKFSTPCVRGGTICWSWGPTAGVGWAGCCWAAWRPR